MPLKFYLKVSLMKNSITFLSLFVCVAIWSCQNQPKEQASNIQNYSVENQTYEKNEGCQSEADTAFCFKMKINYPVLKGGKKEVCDSINAQLYNSILENITVMVDEENQQEKPTTFDAAAKNLISMLTDFKENMKNDEPFYEEWNIETDSRYLGTHGNISSFRIDVFSYTGGAHPNSYTTLLSFDMETGKRIESNNWFSDTLAVTKMVEASFRKEREISETANLEEEGFFLQDGKFFLPANIGLDSSGVVFYYNDYEIGPHVMGPTGFTVPYTQIKPLLSDSFVKMLKK